MLPVMALADLRKRRQTPGQKKKYEEFPEQTNKINAKLGVLLCSRESKTTGSLVDLSL
jgi:hypothetical protein